MAERCKKSMSACRTNCMQNNLAISRPMQSASKQPWMVRFSTFFITTCHQTITTSIRCCGKLLLLPATIAMTKMIKVLLHISLPFDPLLGSWGGTDGNNKSTPLSTLMQSLHPCPPS